MQALLLLLLGLLGYAAAYSLRPIQVEAETFRPNLTAITRPCSSGDECEHVYYRNYVNDVPYCCPHGNGIMKSVFTEIDGESNMECMCSNEDLHAQESLGRFNWRSWHQRWRTFNGQMREMFRELGGMFRDHPFSGFWLRK